LIACPMWASCDFYACPWGSFAACGVRVPAIVSSDCWVFRGSSLARGADAVVLFAVWRGGFNALVIRGGYGFLYEEGVARLKAPVIRERGVLRVSFSDTRAPEHDFVLEEPVPLRRVLDAVSRLSDYEILYNDPVAAPSLPGSIIGLLVGQEALGLVEHGGLVCAGWTSNQVLVDEVLAELKRH